MLMVLSGAVMYAVYVHDDATSLRDAVRYRSIIIDPGHGGSDPGAVYGSLCEDEVNYDIAVRLYNKLKRARSSVFITVKDHSFPEPPGGLFCSGSEVLFNGAEVSVNERIKLISMFDPAQKALVVSIHVNSLPSAVRGVSFYYPGEGEQRKKVSRAAAQLLSGALLARNVQPLSLDLGIVTWNFNPVRSHIYRWNFIPAIFSRTGNRAVVLCELGNIRNAKDRGMLSSRRYREFLADRLYHALSSILQ